jgi:hypothetical protein
MIIFPALEFKEARVFSERATELLSDSEYSAFQRTLTLDPERGEIIPHTAGARKVRVPLAGRGKRGGGRVVYYYQVADVIHLLLIYPKNERENLTPDQAKWVRGIVGLIKDGRL